MQNKLKKLFLCSVLCALCSVNCFAAGEIIDDVSANAVAAYDVNGTVFQKITDLEQDKILMQLEKEKAQLDLELDRLAAEKIKLHMEIDTLSGKAEEQQAALDAAAAKIEAETAKLEREKQALNSPSTSTGASTKKEDTSADSIVSKYTLIDIIGAGGQLQATVHDQNNGQRKKISVGKTLDGYTIKSISLDEGVTFTKNGKTETLNIGKEK